MAEPQKQHTRLAPMLCLLGVLVLAAGLPCAASRLEDDTATPAPPPPPPTTQMRDVQAGLARHRPWQDPPLQERQLRYWPVVRRLSEREGMDPALVMAVVDVESDFDPQAESQRGAKGLMQLSPVTAHSLGLKNPADPEANLRAGIRYLSSLKKIFQDDMVLTLAAYNAGPTKVQRAGGAVPDIDETRDFVEQVLAQTDLYRSRLGRELR